MVHRDSKKYIQEFVGISERIAVVNLKPSERKISIIQIYAPTEAGLEEELEAFYEDSDRATTTYKTNTMIITGDFNSKVGTRQQTEKLLDPYGIGTRNNRGSRLI